MASGRWGDAASAPFGHSATGPNPTDRAKQGTKRSMLTDGAGIPLALVAEGANRHSCKLLCATLNGIVIARPAPSQKYPQHLCLDAGYDSPIIRLLVKARGYVEHLRSPGQEKTEKTRIPGHRARRWVVERTFSWVGRSRPFARDHEGLPSSSEAFIQLLMSRLMLTRLAPFLSRRWVSNSE